MKGTLQWTLCPAAYKVSSVRKVLEVASVKTGPNIFGQDSDGKFSPVQAPTPFYPKSNFNTMSPIRPIHAFIVSSMSLTVGFVLKFVIPVI